tara:strand:- start:267 stop:653 length:387 start_codon:yes stop_codon:yes gene_type:complete
MPSLYGKYIYGDWCTGDIWALTYSEDNNHLNEHLLSTDINITTFGIDQNNELLFSGNESIYKFSPEIELLMGDVNYDGEINILDVLQIISYILGNSDFTNEQEFLSDLNSDDVINVLDVIQIVNIILN